jgi:hypothetical protein
MGCGMPTCHIDSLFVPSQKTDLKIVMSTTFIVIWMSMVRSLIGYVIDEMVDVDDEIIRQLIEWDCNVSSETD